MNITKKQREIVYAKFGGKCAYCGCDLPQRWHVDHVEPVKRGTGYKVVNGMGKFYQTGVASNPERHTIDNMMPSCPQCNINKGPFSIEQWRSHIMIHLKALERHSTYRVCRSHGLIKETGAKVVFYFEKLQMEKAA